MDQHAHAPHALEWGIKQSLVRYVLGMHDGSVAVTKPASATEAGYRFPADAARPTSSDGALRFSGTVTLSGHGGLLKIVVADPWLVPVTGAVAGSPVSGSAEDRWSLTIADPYEPGSRLVFATVDGLDLQTGTAHGTRLTGDGADLFFSGPYSEGTELDDPRVVRGG
jgi:hypothetical protein